MIDVIYIIYKLLQHTFIIITAFSVVDLRYSVSLLFLCSHDTYRNHSYSTFTFN